MKIFAKKFNKMTYIFIIGFSTFFCSPGFFPTGYTEHASKIGFWRRRQPLPLSPPASPSCFGASFA
jgi:hypothetical protein